MEYKDYYDALGINRDATQDEIKRAYRKLARRYHPDVSKEADAESQFKQVGEAYAVLKDPEKRAAYDQLGKDWASGQEFRPPPDWASGFEFTGGGSNDTHSSDHSEFFSSLFGRGFEQTNRGPSRHRANARGEDHHAKVLIQLEDAYQGATRSIALRTPALDNSGHLTHIERTLNVKIPKGVKQGQRIRLSGQGSPGSGAGKPGDLYLEVQFEAHGIYRVDGRDVFVDLPITPWEAALGGTVKAPTPMGPVHLEIPAGAVDGRRLRLKGRGIPGKPPGDLYAITKLTVPPADSEAAKALYQKMKQELDYNPRSNLGV